MSDDILFIDKCPHCGSYARIRRQNRTVVKGKQCRNCYVYCPECDARGARILYDLFTTSSDAEEVAIAMWNQRVDEND